MRIPDRIATKAKAVIGGIGMLVTAATAALADNVLSVDEVGTLAAVLIEAAVLGWAAWRVPNRGQVNVSTPQQ